MRDRNSLFCEADLDNQLRAKKSQVSEVINCIPEQQFLISKDEELVEHIVANHAVQPLVLHEEAKTMEQSETEVDVSRDPERRFRSGHSGPVYVHGSVFH